MPRQALILNSPKLKVATTQAGLTAGQAVECQITSAVVTPTQNYATTPPTGCAPPTQTPGLTSWALTINFLQDWHGSAAISLSQFLMTNDGKSAWFELTPDIATATTKIVGNGYAAAASYGGEFGTGVACNATSTWPLLVAPTITAPALLMADEQAAAEQAADDQAAATDTEAAPAAAEAAPEPVPV